jgi:hypothetical protein
VRSCRSSVRPGVAPGEERRLEAEQPQVSQRIGEPMPGEQWLVIGQLELYQPADIELGVGQALSQPRQPQRGMRRLGAQLLDLPLEPTLELVGRDGRTRMAADRELNHGPRIGAADARSNGVHRASRLARVGRSEETWSFRRMGAAAPAGEHEWTMRRNPLVNFHRSAEAAGYPALLIVSMISLALVVVPVTLLALTRAAWMLALAALSVPLALTVLAAAIGAAFSESDRSDRCWWGLVAMCSPRTATRS